VTGRPRVAIVVQRYGAEVVGGAEHLARLLATTVLGPWAEVTVLTTCALDYRTWEDHYPAGPGELDGVPVLRFPVPEPRDYAAFDRLTAAVQADPADAALGARWVRAEGPVSPGLLDHLREAGRTYDAVVFVTYLYASTVLGLPLVADRAILVPTLHDEPPARLAVFDPVFSAARVLMFSTEEERDFAATRFGVTPERGLVAGAGVDDPPPVDREAFARANGLSRPYALCVGRLDPSKGTDTLIADHRRYREARPDGLDLVLVGTGAMPLPDEPWLIATGFLDDRAKHEAIAGAAVVVVPSPYESLSLSQMDAWSHGRPTLANAASPVLEGQSRRSGGGLWYRDGAEYAVMLDTLARNPALADAIGRQGRRGVRRMHSWDHVRGVWREAVGRVAAGWGA
jgi:glycosyltransferase involved in cell wall biosynthesis